MMLELGTQAPDFTLQDKNGKDVSLHDFRGKKVILYFYPKDDTAGCTKQACGFAALYPDFEEAGAVVIGISKDTAASHLKFATKYELPFVLLADPEHRVIEAYDVWKEKSMFGKKYMGTERSTYVIDENGVIVKAFGKVRPADNPKKMLKEVQA